MRKFVSECQAWNQLRLVPSLPTPLLAFAFLIFFATGPACADDAIPFAEQVKPILSDKCFACHGPDAQQRVSELRLDDPASALDPELSVIVPGKPDESLLLTRIHSADPDEVMPPADQVKQLTPEQKNILRLWIQQGAQWETHWSFRPLTKPTIPAAEWPEAEVQHPIDRFVMAKLQSLNLQPSPAAQPQTLLRRLSFDLCGLPPTLEEQNQFEQQIKELGFTQAYQQQVDRLLASPAFGERLAVYWLDLVRYADTVGYHGDQPVSVSPYRDWVIRSLNENMPFDQFTLQQIAGDLLPEPTQDQLIASGYNRLGMMSAEGGVQPEEYLLKYAADRVRTTGTAWLGLTLGCAECHDHKFDPISTRDFYQFSAFFADIKEEGLYSGANSTGQWGPMIDVADPELPQLLQPIEQQLAELKSQMGSDQEVAEKVRQWEQTQEENDWKSLKIASAHSAAGATLESQDDDSILVSGPNPASDVYRLTVDLPEGTRAIRLDAIPDARLPAGGSGRASNGNLVVSEVMLLPGDLSPEAQFSSADQLPEDLASSWIRFNAASATIEQSFAGEGHPDKKWSAASAIDGDSRGANWGWAILPDVGRRQQLVLQLAEPVSGRHTIVIMQNHGTNHTVGRFGLAASTSADAKVSPRLQLPSAVADALQIDFDQRTDQQLHVVADHWRSIAEELAPIRSQIQALEKQRSELQQQHTRATLVTVSIPAREVRILPRGDWMNKSGDVVKPQVPSALGALDKPEANRLDLARWLTSTENPITARVFVNRLWRIYFGKGLSNVLDDLGAQGEPPTHPLLLDYLTSDFASDWDIKRAIRSIVTSNVYQQSSAYRADLKTIDPANRLLARQSRFRLDAEFIRDHALSVSGLLVNQVGGASVYPYQPAGLYRHLNFPTREYVASDGSDQYRRGLYTHWQRQFLHPAMKTFDAPPREECTAARPRSSTPLAALLMLNDPSYVEAAAALASRVSEMENDDAARIDAMFRLGFSRVATQQEKTVLLNLLAEHRKYFVQHPEEARQLLQVGLQPDPTAETSAEELATQAAWTSVARAVMNMHEFISRR